MENKRLKITLILIIMFLFIFNINKINAIDELPDNSAKISSAVITQTKTGTGPFDENDEPGNDSSENNNIVRSFDEVTWTIENTIVLKDENTTSYSGGRIYFEATLPDIFTSETIKWNLDSMGWVENAQISSDGLTLTGYYSMSKDDISVPGKQTLIFAVKVLGAKNGTELQPTIKLWLNGNSQEDYYIVMPKKVYISSSARYNVKLSRNTSCATKTTVNLDGKDVTGRMYGYSVILQLYNKDVSKGLKGIEYPTGDITVDVNMEFDRSNSDGQLEDITEYCTPILWDYKINNGNTYGNLNRNMKVSNEAHYAIRSAPMGVLGNPDYSVYDSGNISAIQQDATIKFTISGYKFNGDFPIYNTSSSTQSYTENIGCFSVGYFQVMVPYNEYSTVEGRDYYIKLNDSNFKATSLSGNEVTNQVITTDDSSNAQHLIYKAGSYGQLFNCFDPSGNNKLLSTTDSSGDAYITKGSTFSLALGVTMATNNENDIYTVDKMAKFNGEAFLPVKYNDGSTYKFDNMKTMKFKMWYLTKKDGTNWSSEDEKKNTNIYDMNMYETLEEIPEGYLCTGVYWESISGYIYPGEWNHTFHILLKVKDDAKIGEVYSFQGTQRLWKEALDRSVYSQSIINGYDEYPKSEYYSGNVNYIKTKYDENGSKVAGTHNGGYSAGTSILIVGAEQKITINAVDENGTDKESYDLGKNENIVNYNIVPTISSSVQDTNISGVNLKITNTVPVGMSYVAGSSNYGDPEVINNNDGTVNLIWNIYNCSVNKTITPVNLKLSIDENSANGTQYINTAIIQEIINPDETPKIANAILSKRTTTNTISVVNLSSQRLYNITDTPVIEKNGEIHYTVTYKNNTDELISDFQMLDILPYNGDVRGTEYTGDYTLDRIIVTQQNEDGETISNDNLGILYTNDEGVRSGVTSKDENLGAGWSSVTSEKLNQKVTAYVIKGEIEAKGNVTVDIYLKTNGNKGLDKYVNSVTAQVYKETEEMTTSNVVSQVVKRSIEGIVWDDSNRNGVKDEGENVFGNVEMTLTDEFGQQVTDVNGNNVTNIKTDDNGYYKFENLPKGNYYVQVTMPNEKYELTEKAVGTNNEINSKFNKEDNETDKITYLNSIDLPELTVSHVNAGFVKIEGSIDITKVDKKDNSKVIEGATFKLERIDDTGNVDSTFDAEEKTTNSEGKIEFIGLEVGKYKVTEIQAPEGYELLKDSIEVNITGENRDVKLLAQNELKLILPETGSINNTIVFIVVGMVIIAISIVLNKIYKNKKMRT